jgi:acyl-CoA thioesterase I
MSDSNAGTMHMADAPQVCDPHLDLFPFAYPLRHLTESIKSGRKTKIVAIGSSSTAGEPVPPDWQVKVVPYPARLELALRLKYQGVTIDVLNRGIGGQEATQELLRFDPDVIAEDPALVIWQVGTNAVFRNNDFKLPDVEAAIKAGLGRLAQLPADVVLMDLQYTTAVTGPDKIALSQQMEQIILDAAKEAKVNVFRRWALMEKWVSDKVATIADLTDPADTDNQLHMSEWATACVSQALAGAIVKAAPPPQNQA